MAPLFALLSALSLASAVGPAELESYLSSPSGLGLSRDAARSTAQREAPVLTASGVTVDDLTRLRQALWDQNTMAYSLAELRAELIPLAEQHVHPDSLRPMFDVLYEFRGMDLGQAEARASTLELVRNSTAPAQVKSLWDKIMRMALPWSDMRPYTVTFAAAGCDAHALANTFDDTGDIDKAGADGARAFLSGLPRRLAKDGQAYDAKGFQDYYPRTWMAEWLAAPQEKKVAPDGKEYTASEFHDYFGACWEAQFSKAQVATQRRIAEDGAAHSQQEFYAHYKSSWQEKWNQAPVVPCEECRAESLLVV